MAEVGQVHLYLILIFLSGAFSESTSTQENEDDVILSESNNRKLEIVKKIKKINEDGSYTIGYEADDGSFKIESRDVLGHIKGTYGFVDDKGQIKRVSYSTSNASEVISKPEEPSVVQRIPLRKQMTKFVSSTPLIPSSSSVVQSIPRRKTMSEATTKKPNYENVVNISQSTTVPNYVSSLSQTDASNLNHQKTNRGGIQETEKPDKLFHYYQDRLVNSYEPVGNLQRRQLSSQSEQDYNAHDHISRLQQSLGQDATDVYSNSMTTGTPRPLFTTTNRPKFTQTSTTSTPSTIQRPSVFDDPVNDFDSSSRYSQRATTIHSEGNNFTPPIPQLRVSNDKVDNRIQLLDIKSANERGTVLLPVSKFNGRLLTREQLDELYGPPKSGQYNIPPSTRKPVEEFNQEEAPVKIPPTRILRPMPVEVDENGYIKELLRPSQIVYQVAAEPEPKYDENNIDDIHPPVSTKDFHRLLQQLIIRQNRLEKISEMTRHVDIYMQPRPVMRAVDPYFLQRELLSSSNTPTFQEQDRNHRQNVVEIGFQQLNTFRNYPSNEVYSEQRQQSYKPNRRVARLLPPSSFHHSEKHEEYLPSDVREMLLLRMLQLAINPSLPLPEKDYDSIAKSTTFKKNPVRNVEILGEGNSEEQ
nr:uncharacterized protein LOC111503604 [Leptinotarsa decemlineata]